VASNKELSVAWGAPIFTPFCGGAPFFYPIIQTGIQMSDESKNGSSISTDLYDNGIFLLGDIDEKNCFDAIEFILESNLTLNPTYDHLTLIINSRGGSMFDGFALIDAMCGSRLPVWTTGVGVIASMGLLIFMNGSKGNRILTPNTMILSHQWWSINWGKEHELVAARKKNNLMSDMVMRHYKKCTGMREKDIKNILLPASDIWLTSEEALKYGLCDEIRYLTKENNGKKRKEKRSL
jgi:ATP-dependent Clp protease protease subunit